MNDLLLEKYAKLLVATGLNVQKGQRLIVSCPVECAYFGRKCVSAAYDLGCKEVIMRWRDDFCTRQTYLRADDSVFDECPDWLVEYNDFYSKTRTAMLSIYATDPENLKGVDPDRLKRQQIAMGKRMTEYRKRQMVNYFPWCVASIPTNTWAKKVFPADTEEKAVEKLWEAIFSAVRIDETTDPVEEWNKHIAKLAARAKKLNDYNFKALRYKNSIGTDLTVELAVGHIWEGGAENTENGVTFVPNMPTEEIFTAPKRDGVNGTVASAMPLVDGGNIIDKFILTLKDGKIVDAKAEVGEEFLKAAIAVDEGASYLGEVALIPIDSPIAKSKILFYNTLFDENASCHFAFGEAYPSTLKGGESMTKEELKEKGLNDSITHVDFMVGTDDLSVTGITFDGKEIPVFVDGKFSDIFA